MKKKTQAINQEFLDRARSLDRENRSVPGTSGRNSAKKLLGQARQRAVFKPTTCHFSAHTDATEHDSLSRSLQS